MTRSSSCLIVVATVLGAAAFGCGGVQKIERDPSQAVRIADFEANPEAFAAKLQNPGDGIFVALKKGDAVALKLALDAPGLAALETQGNRIRFERDVYLFISKDGALLSPDARRWARIQDAKALKDVFGIQGGTLQIGFGASQEEGASIAITLGMK